MNIQDLLKSTSEITLDLNSNTHISGLMGIDAHQVVGGQKDNVHVQRTYGTAIETITSNGQVFAESISDTSEEGDSLPTA